LVRNAGGSQRQWRLAIGPVTQHDVTTHSHCNSSVAPSGSARENELIETLLDSLRLRHPMVVAG
jgi:hypothetical protein